MKTPATDAPRRKHRRSDPDIIVLKACCKALDRSTSPAMLRAGLEFLVDRYLRNPRKAK